MFGFSSDVLRLCRVRTQRPLAVDTERDGIVDKLGRYDFLGSDILLHPSHERQQSIVKRILESRNRMDIRAEYGGLVRTREVPGTICISNFVSLRPLL